MTELAFLKSMLLSQNQLIPWSVRPSHRGECWAKILHSSLLQTQLLSCSVCSLSSLICDKEMQRTTSTAAETCNLQQYILEEACPFMGQKNSKLNDKICDKVYYHKDHISYVLHIGTNLTTRSLLKSRIFTRY